MPTAPPWLRIQLSGPRGLLARPMAHFLNKMNGADYRRALARLDAQPGETVLELGFGGGVGVEALLDAGAKVIASEPAEAMRERAFRRFSSALARGELEVWPHPAEALPERPVARALSMNTVYFWADIERGFANLRAMVERRVVLGVASPQHLVDAGFDEQGFRVRPVEWYGERLVAAGFRVEVERSGDVRQANLVVAEPS